MVGPERKREAVQHVRHALEVSERRACTTIEVAREAEPPATLPSKKWRDVILKVWHTDPLLCPHCQHKMEVIAVIHQRLVIERILRHVGLWSGTPRMAPSRAPPREQTEHRSSPDDMSDPMPDYENVYTD